MNKILLIVSLFVSTSAFADSSNNLKLVCQEYNRVTGEMLQKTVVLTPAGESKEKRDENGDYIAMETPYDFELFDGAKPDAIASASGTVLSEDVNFDFQSIDGVVTFFVFLDEMNESSLVISAGPAATQLSDYNCR